MEKTVTIEELTENTVFNIEKTKKCIDEINKDLNELFHKRYNDFIYAHEVSDIINKHLN